MKKSWKEILIFFGFIGLVVFICILELETWKWRIIIIVQTLIFIKFADLSKVLAERLNQLGYKQSSEEEIRMAAIHEAGHTMVAILLGVNIEKTTIKCNGSTAGYTECEPYKGVYFTKEMYMKNIQIFYGGKAAEDVLLNMVTSGPYDDLQKATEMCLEMISDYGMGDQLLTNTSKYKQVNKIITERNTQIAEEICKECYNKSRMLINANKQLVEEFAEILIEKEEMTQEDVEQFKKEHNI